MLSFLALVAGGAVGLFAGAAVGGNTTMGYEQGGNIGFFCGIGAAVAGIAWAWRTRR